mgnify:CR=1 FL=1
MNFFFIRKRKELKKICIGIIIYTVVFIISFTIQNLIYLSKTKDRVVNTLKTDIVNSQSEIARTLKIYENELKNLSLRMLDNSSILLYVTGKTASRQNYINVNNSILSYLTYSKASLACVYNMYTDNGYVFSELTTNLYDNETVKKIVDNYNNGNFYYVVNDNKSTPAITYTTKDYRGIYIIYQINNYDLRTLKRNLNNNDIYIYYNDYCLLRSNNSNYSISKIREKINGSDEFYYENNYVVSSHILDFDIITIIDKDKILSEASSGMQPFITMFYSMLVCLFVISVIGYIVMNKFFENTVLSLAGGGQHLEQGKLILRDLFNKKVIDEAGRDVLDKEFCNKKYFRCIYLHLDEENINNSVNTDDDLFNNLLVNACNKNEFGKETDINIALVNKYAVGLFISSDVEIDDSNVNNFISSIHCSGAGGDKILFTCIIGKEFSDARQIPKQILQTVNYIKYEFVAGFNSTIFVGDMDYLLKSAEYPAQIEDEIINAINDRNYDGYYNGIEQFLLYANNLDPAIVKEWLLRLVFSMAKNIYCINKKDISFEIIDKLSKSRTIDEAINIFEMCIPFESITSSNETQDSDFANMIKKHIEHNYANVDFNLAYLSDLVGMSTAYLGKLIKNTLNTTFSDYLSNYRVNKARELLSTDIKIDDISRMCGFGSTSYFIKIFKKTFGVTPKMYREKGI